jgi:hypothetical protein
MGKMLAFKKPNVLFVSGDLVTDLCMDGMFKFHEEHNSMFTCLLSDFTLNGAVPGTKERQKKCKKNSIYIYYNYGMTLS